jgi:hypothetical protein
MGDTIATTSRPAEIARWRSSHPVLLHLHPLTTRRRQPLQLRELPAGRGQFLQDRRPLRSRPTCRGNVTFHGISKLTCIGKGGFLYTSRRTCIENGLSLYTFTLIRRCREYNFYPIRQCFRKPGHPWCCRTHVRPSPGCARRRAPQSSPALGVARARGKSVSPICRPRRRPGQTA